MHGQVYHFCDIVFVISMPILFQCLLTKHITLNLSIKTLFYINNLNMKTYAYFFLTKLHSLFAMDFSKFDMY
jgi:hypothetical protein